MDGNVFEAAVDWIEAITPPYSTARITFQGGEPLMLRPEWYERNLDLLRGVSDGDWIWRCRATCGYSANASARYFASMEYLSLRAWMDRHISTIPSVVRAASPAPLPA